MSAEEMKPMRYAWQEAAAVPDSPTIFQSFDWNQAAARIFDASQSPFVVMAQSDSGTAIIPACVDFSNRRISLMGEELFDYRDALATGDPSLLQQCWESIIALSEKTGLGFGFHALCATFAQDRWQRLPVAPFASAPCISAADLSTFHHPRLALNMRRLQRAGAVLREHAGDDAAILRNIYALKSQEPGSLFGDPARMRMLLAMASSAGARCNIFSLEHCNTLVSALVTFRDRNWRRFYTTYYSEAWAKHSPGLTLLHEVVRKSLAEGLDCDFMTGAQPYKQRLATTEVPLYRVSASPEELRAMRLEPVLAESAEAARTSH